MEVNAIKLPGPGIPNVSVIADNTAANQTTNPQDAAQVDQDKALSLDTLDRLTKALNKFTESMDVDLKFMLHEGTERLMVQVVDVKTDKVVKEFPPHELLDTLAAIRQYIGVLLDEKA